MKITTSRIYDPLVYSTSRWQESLFDKRAKGSRLGSVIGSTAKALALEGEAEGKAGALGLEVFSRLYDSPEKLEEPAAGSPWAGKVHEMLDQMDEFRTLADLTSSDPDMAALGTAELLQAVEGRLGELVKEAEQQAQGQPAQGQAPAGRPGFQITATDKVRAILRGACRDARQSVAEAKAALDGILPGLGSAPSVHEQEDPRRLVLAQTLLSSPKLRKIVDLAGRLERIAAQVKKQRNPDLREEVVDIERGGDLGRILPSELAGLRSSRIRRLQTLQRVADRTALQYRLDGKEPQGRGEMIVALDESGSMGVHQNGIIPNDYARAIGLACLRIASKDRRAITIVGFNGGLTSRHRMDRSGSCYRWSGSAWTPIPGGLGSMALEIISRGCSGGTSFDAPIRFAIQAVQGETRPDILFVTDGEAFVTQAVLDELAEAKAKRGLRVFGVAMGHGRITPQMDAVCDHAIDFSPDLQTLARVVPG